MMRKFYLNKACAPTPPPIFSGSLLLILPLLCFAILTALILFVFLFSPLLAQATPPQDQNSDAVNAPGPIVLGVGNGLEDQLLAQLVLQLLQKEGYTVRVQPNLGATSLEMHRALQQGRADLAWSYVGDVLPSLPAFTRTERLDDPAAAWAQLASLDEAESQLIWLKPSAINRSVGLVLRPDAIYKAIHSISDLAALLQENDAAVRFCVENEFYVRPTGLPTLEALYAFAFAPAATQLVGRGEELDTLYNDGCDVALGIRTDSRIERWGLRLLADPREYFPSNQGALVIRDAVLTEHPALRDLLERLTTTLSETRFRRLLREAEDQPDLLALFADSYLLETGLVPNSFLAAQSQTEPIAPNNQPVVLGAGSDVEQEMVIELAAWLLERAGYTVEIGADPKRDFATLHSALIRGRLDIVWGDIRVATQEIYGNSLERIPTDGQEAWARLATLDYKQNQLVWLPPALFNRGPGLILRPGAVAKNLQTIADLADYVQTGETPLRLCVENDFYIRPTGLTALEARYGFAFDPKLIQLLKREELLPSLHDGRCDVTIGNRTDTRIALWKLQTLADPEGYFPVSQSAFALRSDLLAAQPQLREILKPLASLLTEDTIRDLTLRVTVGADQLPNTGDEENRTRLAETVLLNAHLMRPRPLVVGSNHYPLERFLGKMALYVLQQGGFEVVDRTGLGDSVALRQALLTGEVDIAIDRTGPALAMHHRLPPVRWPLDAKRTFDLVQQLDGDKGLIWLQPSPFNNVYVLFAAPELAQRGVANLLDLSTLISQTDAPLTLCADTEFIERVDGLQGVEQAYAVAFPNVQEMDMEEVATLLQGGRCPLVVRQATDRASMIANGYLALEDSRGFLPYANLAFVVQAERLRTQPQIGELLTPLSALLTEERIKAFAAADLWHAEDATIMAQIANLLAGVPVPLPAVALRAPLSSTAEISALSPITASLLAVTTVVKLQMPPNPTLVFTSTAPVAVSSAALTLTEPVFAQAPLTETRSSPENQIVDSSVITEALPQTMTGLLTIFQSIRAPSEITAAVPVSVAQEPITQVVGLAQVIATPVATTEGEVTATTEVVTEVVMDSTSHSTVTHPIVVGAASDPLHQLLAQLYIAAFAGNGLLVIDQTAMQDMAEVRAAMRAGEVDFTVDFVGSALALYHGVPITAAPTDAEVAYSLLKRLDEPLGILWLNRGEFQDNSLLLVEDQPWMAGIRTIGDLARLFIDNTQPGTFCANAQFLQDSASGLADLEKLYGFRWPEVEQRSMPLADIYAAVRDRECIVGLGRSSDWRVSTWRLHMLEDDLAFFAANPVAAVGRQEILDETPGLAPLVAAITEKLESETVRQLLTQIAVGADGQAENGDEQSIRLVATNFVCGAGLLGDCPAITVGGVITAQATLTQPQPLQAEPLPNGETLRATAEISANGSGPTVTIPVSATTTISTPTLELASPVLPTIVAIAVPSAFQVNMRAAPQPDAPVIAILKGGSILAAIGRTADTIWLRVLLPDGRLGWVFQSTVKAPLAELEKLPVVPMP